MKVKSMKSFRHWFKMSKSGYQDDVWNSDFTGFMKNGIMGFFAMYHGDKEDVYGFLRKEIEMAEDGQAVYEFVQNAADSNSTHFYMFYNEKYFLAINNGEMFPINGIKSILNVGQSHGKEDDPDKIGRFGIGFKLVHRLVGKNNGLKEITEDYCGPQLFSWNSKNDFIEFSESGTLEEQDVNSNSPWLMKILLTNFPASVNEIIKDQEFNDRIPYTMEEFNEFQTYFKQNLSRIDSNSMSQGTMIFIKLGEDKISLLNKDQEDINHRLENTLYFLKNLSHLQVNEKVIKRKNDFVVEDSFVINPDEPDFQRIGLDEKRDKSFPVKFQLGYSPYGKEAEIVKEYPNFYKYFPMEDTTYGLRFIFHSNVFSIGSNRRHIHEDKVNIQLLNLFAEKIIVRLEEHIKKSSFNAYDIIANVLLSECTKPFVSEHLIDKILGFILQNVPTDKGEFKNKADVIIKNTSINCEPSDFGLNLSWFKWNAFSEKDKELIEQSKSSTKLGLESFSLKRLLEKGSLSNINSWIKKLDDYNYNEFIIELNDNIPTNITDIEFIKFDDGSYKSIRNLNASSIIRFPKISEITNVLKSLGFSLSVYDFESYESIKNKISDYHEYLKPEAESKLYEKYLCGVLPTNTLSPSEKKNLFLALEKFKYIAERTLANELMLFSNTDGIIMPLSKMVNPKTNGIESWLLEFCIRNEEVFDEITSKDYLRNEHTLFNDIIFHNWDSIISKIESINVNEYLHSVKKYFNLTEIPVSIKSKPFIFNENYEWINISNSVFYHSQLIGFPKYVDFIELIQKNDLMIPDSKLYSLYSEEPFTINDSNLNLLLNQNVYSRDAVIALLEFCKGKVNVFEYGLFSANIDGTVLFSTDQNSQQYYSSKQDVHDFINEYCSENLIALPGFLSAYKEFVLRDQDLYKNIKEISYDSWIDDNECLIDLLHLLADSGLTKIIKEFLFEQSKISISEDVDKLTLAWINLINSVLEIHEINELRYKLYIDGIKLCELNWNNIVTLENTETVELGNILDKFNDNQVIANIKDGLLILNSFDANKINAIFQSEAEPNDDELKNISDEMLNYEQKRIKNTDQLRLVLYLFKNQKISSIKEIEVQALNNEWYSLEDDWYLKSLSFIDDAAVLHSRYENIGRKNGNNFSILTKPYFNREKNIFICSHISDNLTDNELIELLELVKDQIIKNAQSRVYWLDSLTSSIGFSPSYTINAESEIIYNDEKLPEVVINWAFKSKENANVLEVLGVNGSLSPIAQLRRAFLNPTEGYNFEGFSRSNKADQYFLRNTFHWLSLEEMTLEDNVADLVNNITDFLGVNDDISEQYFPIVVKVVGIELYSQLRPSNNPYCFNHETISTIKSLNIGNVSDIIQQLIDAGCDLIDSDFLSEQWMNKYCNSIEFSEPEVNIDKLDELSVPCELPQYLNWKKSTERELEIRIITTPIPMNISVNALDESIDLHQGMYCYDENNQILYSNEEFYDEAVRKGLSDILEFDELFELLNGHAIAINRSREEDLLSEIKLLKEQLNKLGPNEEAEMERGGLSGDSQKDWNLEARELLRDYLEKIPEFDCSNWDDSNVPSTIINGVLFQGKKCIWIVRSAMSQKAQFHLTPYEWSILEGKNVFLALRTSTGNIQIFGINEDIRKTIFENNHTINFNFDSVMLSFDGMNALANTLVHYNIWGSGLVFKNPNYSAGVSLEKLQECKEGIANKLSDDSL